MPSLEEEKKKEKQNLDLWDKFFGSDPNFVPLVTATVNQEKEEDKVTAAEDDKKPVSSPISDLYNDGNVVINAWQDEDNIYINFPFVCLNIPIDMAHALGHDLADLAEILLDTFPPSDEDEDDFEGDDNGNNDSGDMSVKQ